MNLKRLRGIATVALITIAAALFAGCSNSMAGSVDGGSNARMATLSLSATGIPNDYEEQIRKAYANVESRSIVPNAPYTPADADDLTFYLSGSSERGTKLTDMEVVLVEVTGTTPTEWELKKKDGSNNVPITLDAMSWSLVLTAYKTYTSQGAAGNEPVLQGFCTVDLRYGSASASFVMGTAGLTTKGSVTLSGTIVDKDDAAVAYTMGIYRMDTGLAVAGTEQNGTLNSTGGNTTDETFDYNKTTVEPGTYWYKMIFYAESTKETIVGSYMDTIIVEPGNDLVQGGIVVDVIGKKPTQPEDLMAYLISGTESSEGTTYDVKVTWTQSKYATNYELNVAEFDGNEDVIDTTFTVDATTKRIEAGTIYGMASMAKASDNVKNFLDVNSKVGVKNNSTALMYGTDSCTLTLETGKLYEIQLRARNYIGVSDWANRGEATDDSDADTVEYDAPANQRINRLLIKYNLDGGTLKVGSNSYTIEYAEYYTWKKSDSKYHVILAPLTDSDGAPTTATTLIKGSGTSKSDFKEWKLEKGVAVKGNDSDDSADTIVSLGSTDLAVNKYTYKNATVKAFFGNTVSLSVSAEEKTTNIVFGDVTVKYGKSGATTATPLNEDGSTVNGGDIYVIPKITDNTSTYVQVALTTAPVTHKDIEFVATRQDGTHINLKTEDDNTCYLSTESYAPGEKGTVIVKATDVKTGKLVSYTVTLLMK